MSPSHARPLPIRLLRWSSFLSLALLTACSSPRRDNAEQRMPPQPPLAGESSFFAKTVTATARVSAPQRPALPEGQGHRSEDGARAGGRPGGFGGGFGGPGEGEDRPAFTRMGGGMGPGGGRPGGGGGQGGGMSRQSLVITFQNTGTASVELTVVEVKSLMGNFVPVPETFTLAPGQSQALEPMRSRLSNLDELAVNVTLRRGDESETQVLELRPTS